MLKLINSYIYTIFKMKTEVYKDCTVVLIHFTLEIVELTLVYFPETQDQSVALSSEIFTSSSN